MSDDQETAASLVNQFVDLLTVERIGEDLFLGRRKVEGRGRVFGGQVVAQALQAAQATVDEDRVAHSLHAYFLRAGSEDFEIHYRVERDFDGGSFSNRRIVALQEGRPIFNMAASFHRRHEGVRHQFDMPDVPPPEDLRNGDDIMREAAERLPERVRPHFDRHRPIDYRPVDQKGWVDRGKVDPRQSIWFRTVAPLPAVPGLHRAILAYASDSYLLGTAFMPHGLNWTMKGVTSASLDHAVWLHDDFDASDWMLYVCDSPWSGNERGFNRGAIFTRDGRRVADCAQEGLIRYRP